jgi:hypothetical protein
VNPAVLAAAEDLAQRLAGSEYPGTLAEPGEVARLLDELGALLPEWYTRLLATVPLGGCGFEVQAFEPRDGFSGSVLLYWLPLSGIAEEVRELVPGVTIMQRGYVPLAVLDGVGDILASPLALGDDPEVLLVSHEGGSAPNALVRDSVRAASHLSHFFRAGRGVPRGDSAEWDGRYNT